MRAPPPLDLSLPRAASAPPLSPAAQAARDARGNSARKSFGEALADALGSDQGLADEDLGDGRRRIRQGADCIELHEARSAQLDPFSQAARATPKVAKRCN